MKLVNKVFLEMAQLVHRILSLLQLTDVKQDIQDINSNPQLREYLFLTVLPLKLHFWKWYS